jgi:H+/Cl- antiporter ClcA
MATKRPVDMTFVTLYLVTGLAGYGVGLLSIMVSRQTAECQEAAAYIITGLIAAAAGVYFILAALKEAIREARGEGYG